MSDILIRGMKMPKAGMSTTINIHADGTVYVYGTYPTELYKAIPIPSHGRLIDADELEKKIIMLNAHYSYREVVEYADIHNAPTIIEAEVEE